MVIPRPRRKRGTVRPIRLLGDPVLRTSTDPVTSFDPELERLVDDMFASMYAADGAGLAANQIGVGLSIFVFDCADESGRKHVGHVINPTSVVADGGPRTDPEGCLSVPHLFFDAERQAHAVVEGVDLHGEPVRVQGDGYLARCLQHETDHLRGGVFLDRLTGDERRSALREVRSADWSH
jgi:peptide deformylase